MGKGETERLVVRCNRLVVAACSAGWWVTGGRAAEHLWLRP